MDFVFQIFSGAVSVVGFHARNAPSMVSISSLSHLLLEGVVVSQCNSEPDE